MTSNIRTKLLVAGASAAFCMSVFAASAMTQEAVKPDNSAQNANQSETAQNQSSARSDRETTARIRRAIIADKDLSMYAHNVKIITRNGSVTLKGPVKSEDEKRKVESDAAAVVAGDSLVDQLTVKQ